MTSNHGSVCVRERFGLDFVSNFAEEASRKYLLKTRAASYEYEKDFVFGNEIFG